MGSYILNLPLVLLNSHSTEEGFQQFNFTPPPPFSLSFLSPTHFSPPLLLFFLSRVWSQASTPKTPRVASLNTAREELIHTCSTENATEVQEDLKDLMTSVFCFKLLKLNTDLCAKPIIELDICYISQPEISRFFDVTRICKWLLSSFCYWNYRLNSVSVQQQHCRCVHHK